MWIFPNQDWMIEKFGKGISYLREICKYAQENATEEDIVEIMDTIELIKKAYK